MNEPVVPSLDLNPPSSSSSSATAAAAAAACLPAVSNCVLSNNKHRAPTWTDTCAGLCLVMGDAYDPSRIAIWVVLRAAAGVAIGSVTYDAGKVPGSCFLHCLHFFII